jgi:hypothetical protein
MMGFGYQYTIHIFDFDCLITLTNIQPDLKDSIPGYGPGKFVFEGAHFLVLTIIKIRRMNTFRILIF